MVVKLFLPSRDKPEVLRFLKAGHTPEEACVKYPISERTAYRYLGQLVRCGQAIARQNHTAPIRGTDFPDKVLTIVDLLRRCNEDEQAKILSEVSGILKILST